MKPEQLQKKLLELNKTALRDFIFGLYIKYPELLNEIETLALFNDPAALKKAIAKRVLSVKRGRKFIDYWASSGFASDLRAILNDIESGLLISSPKDAFELVDKFLLTSDSVMNRVDDSNGAIGGVYSDAVFLWLQAAKASGDTSIDWIDRVYQLYKKNDYGVLDTLLPNSDILLNEEQLKQLAWRYEAELRREQKQQVKDGEFNYDLIAVSVALRSVAKALKDPFLYEHAVLINYAEPNDLQKKDIIAEYIANKQFEKALEWLNTNWDSRFEWDRLELLGQVYEQNGDKQQLRKTRELIFQQDSSHNHLVRYLETLDENEQQAVKQKAIEKAQHEGDIITSADLLLQLGEKEFAQRMLVSRHQELADCFYDRLISLAKQFEKQGCLLAATACYRALLLDILNRGYSKAYTHAARYYKKLQSLSDEIQEYQPLIKHIDFIDQLKNDHGRKTSFWKRV